MVAGGVSGPNALQTAFRWDPLGGTGIQLLASPNPRNYAYDVSNGGEVIAGSTMDSLSGRQTPGFWSASSGFEPIVDPTQPFAAAATCVSPDGRFISGFTRGIVEDGPSYTFVWTRDAGHSRLAYPPYSVISPEEISANGEVLIGSAGYPFGPSDGYRWTANSGFELLGTFTDGFQSSRPKATNADGSIIVGNYLVPGPAGSGVFRWSARKE